MGASKDGLLRLLKRGADILRTRVDYKVLLLFLFYKAISDKYLFIVEREKAQGYTLKRAREIANNDLICMYDPETEQLYTWQACAHDPDRFVNALTKLETLNSNTLKGMRELIARTGLNSLFNNPENSRIVTQLIDLFGQVDFSQVDYDILGDAYEWILSYFAPTKAKEGEVYTPIEVSRLMAQLAQPNSDSDLIIDPACGSGSMLIEFYRVAQQHGAIPLLQGQEANEVSAILARLNFILHGIQNVEIYSGDSLLNAQFEKGTITTANPPWNQKGYDKKRLQQSQNKEAYGFGYPTRQSADWAWIQLLAHYTERMSTVVIDTGALFRGSREKQIRRAFIEKDLIESVILLPEKIFYNTTAPAAILIINKEKPTERKNKILFINASQEYQRHPEVKKLNHLTEEHIQKIVDVYRQFKEQKGFSKIVSLDLIKENDYNLNVPLYVAPQQDEEEIDLAEALKAIDALNNDYQKQVEEVTDFLKEAVESLYLFDQTPQS